VVKNVIIGVAAAVVLAIVLLASQKEKPQLQPQPLASRVSTPAESGWLVDYKKAQEQAKSDKKLLLLNFTGSDWCPGCIMLAREVFATEQFKDYASKNFVLVEVDFPRSRLQRPEVAEQNQTLAEHFGIQVFPTVVILNSDGKKIGGLIGYDPDAGVKGYIAELEKFKKG
jgi:thioredoxin-related protein